MLSWVLVGALVLTTYEGLRYLVVRQVRFWFQRGAVRFVRRHRVRLESARFIDRVWIREYLALDPSIDEAVLRQSRDTGQPVALLRDRVDRYVDEIAPFFSMGVYYRIGVRMANWFIAFCYELLIDPDEFRQQAAAAPNGSVRIYVINHRSNFDPIVLGYSLSDQIALSYAVGEWALVWPLSWLFRSFGSYFVRRGEKDPLYHAVLERFVQVLAGHGAVTGFFIEGGLSRDGRLRKPRSGLLTYLVKLRREFPDRELVFLPVGLNYDRVLEDRFLVSQRHGPLPKPSFRQRLMSIGGLMFWVPLLIAANMLKLATRSHRKFGYAAVAFGRPLRLSEWPGGDRLHELDGEALDAAMDALAQELLFERIAEAVPATPVPVFCTAFLRPGPRNSAAMAERVRDVVRELRARGAPVRLGAAFDSVRSRRLDVEIPSVPGGTLDVDVLDLEEAELVVTLASFALVRRKVLERKGGELVALPDQTPVIEYYVHSIAHHLERAARVA